MKIDGQMIADQIILDLKSEVTELTVRGIKPKLAVIVTLDSASTKSFVRQKQLVAERIGASCQIFESVVKDKKELTDLVDTLNQDRQTHGVIIQRPIRPDLAKAGVIRDIAEIKDVDGFNTPSRFTSPVALAVVKILEFAFNHEQIPNLTFPDWLKSRRITVIGRGETAGGPILKYFTKLNCTTSNIHTQTPGPDGILKDSDIVISCIGKKGIITHNNIKNGVILVSVGLYKDDDLRLQGDYDIAEISSKAAYYTPTPGGVGPVNVAFLYQNLLQAVKLAYNI